MKKTKTKKKAAAKKNKLVTKEKKNLVLKLKSVFYRYTGIFLANSEQLDYIDSDAYWKEFRETSVLFDDMDDRQVHGLLIGSWQCHHKFYRPYSFLRHKRPSFFWVPVSNMVSFFTVVRRDFFDPICNYLKSKLISKQ